MNAHGTVPPRSRSSIRAACWGSARGRDHRPGHCALRAGLATPGSDLPLRARRPAPSVSRDNPADLAEPTIRRTDSGRPRLAHDSTCSCGSSSWRSRRPMSTQADRGYQTATGVERAPADGADRPPVPEVLPSSRCFARPHRESMPLLVSSEVATSSPSNRRAVSPCPAQFARPAHSDATSRRSAPTAM